MDLELKWRDLTWFEVLGRATATHEEALETAIPEYCPDMNRIVDATGQLQIRDREITGGAVMVSGMVSVRVLYSSEESSGLRSLEVSVPFRCTQEGGNLAACRVLRAEGRLLLTEAKAVSARRLYVRVLPEVTVTGYGEMHGRLCCAAEGDASLAVRTRETPLRLLSAVAEKQCPFTQETMLQTGQETPEEVLADRLTLRVTDWQNVGTKLLVKGEARLCVLYRGEQQGLCIHEAALPFSQILDGIEAAEIVEIVDHHRLGGLVTAQPLRFNAMPVGSTSAIVVREFGICDVELPKNLAALLLGAMLTDTVIMKSPTTTDFDRKVIAATAEYVGVDPVEYGMEIFKCRSNPAELPVEKIVNADAKEFELANGNKVYIGQFETVDLQAVLGREAEIREAIKALVAEKGYQFVLFFATDILAEGSQFIVEGDVDFVNDTFGIDATDKSVWMPGVLSRKKQVAAPILAHA